MFTFVGNINTMIDAKELRKYNNVYDKNGNVASVFTIGCESVRLSTNTYKAESHNINDIAPIPLTEEMLLKCGFVVTDKLPNNILSIDLGNDTILFEDLSCDRMYIRYYNEENNFDDFDCMSIPQDIHSLHQLQNLYFALTGQELNVEL